MSALTFEQIQTWQDGGEKVDDVVLQLLELFEDGKPLEEERLKKWKFRKGLGGEQIKEAAEMAIKSGWILEDFTGLYLTHEGRNERDRP